MCTAREVALTWRLASGPFPGRCCRPSAKVAHVGQRLDHPASLQHVDTARSSTGGDPPADDFLSALGQFHASGKQGSRGSGWRRIRELPVGYRLERAFVVWLHSEAQTDEPRSAGVPRPGGTTRDLRRSLESFRRRDPTCAPVRPRRIDADRIVPKQASGTAEALL